MYLRFCIKRSFIISRILSLRATVCSSYSFSVLQLPLFPPVRHRRSLPLASISPPLFLDFCTVCFPTVPFSISVSFPVLNLHRGASFHVRRKDSAGGCSLFLYTLSPVSSRAGWRKVGCGIFIPCFCSFVLLRHSSATRSIRDPARF